MGNKTSCFWTEPSDTAVESFRRYVSHEKGKCTGPFSYHNASVNIGEVPYSQDNNGRGDIPSEELKKDPRWPTHCSCGYEFKPEDTWQHNFERHYVDPVTGKKYLLRQAVPGMMWDAYWMSNIYKGPDGKCICLRLPNGVDWLVDGPSTNGPGWTRTGTVPKITARPSIFARQGLPNSYHGFLTDGELEEC